MDIAPCLSIEATEQADSKQEYRIFAFAYLLGTGLFFSPSQALSPQRYSTIDITGEKLSKSGAMSSPISRKSRFQLLSCPGKSPSSSAPPGDGLRAAREHFHEYVKPILVAGAVDWEVIEGRKEGDVRAGLAAKIRRLRRRNGEKGDPRIQRRPPKTGSRRPGK